MKTILDWIKWIGGVAITALLVWSIWTYRTEIIETVTTGLIWILVVAVLWTVTFYISTLNGWHATFMSDNEFAVVSAGDKITRVITNSSNDHARKKVGQWIIDPTPGTDEGTGPLDRYMRNKFGIFFIGWLWPNTKLMRFGTIKVKVDESHDALKAKVVKDPDRVRFMPINFPIPVYVGGIEMASPDDLADTGAPTVKGEALLTLMIGVRNIKEVTLIQGDRLYNLISEIVASVLIKHLGVSMGIGEFLKMDLSAGSPLMKEIRDELNTSDLPEMKIGVEVISMAVNERGIDPADQSVWDAFRKVLTDTLEGRGIARRADGEAEATQKKMKAEAAGWEAIMKASGKHGSAVATASAVKEAKPRVVVFGPATPAISTNDDGGEE